jgi:hypothetical protein
MLCHVAPKRLQIPLLSSFMSFVSHSFVSRRSGTFARILTPRLSSPRGTVFFRSDRTLITLTHSASRIQPAAAPLLLPQHGRIDPLFKRTLVSYHLRRATDTYSTYFAGWASASTPQSSVDPAEAEALQCLEQGTQKLEDVRSLGFSLLYLV